MTLTCKVCGDAYNQDDDTPWTATGTHDPDWNATDGRCYCCNVKFLYDIFGGYLQPRITVNGMDYFGDGSVQEYDPEDLAKLM